MLELLKAANFFEVGAFFLLANIVIFLSSILLCWGLGIMFREKRIFDRWEPIRAIELAAAFFTVILNVGISVIGWSLWSHGIIAVTSSSLLRSVIDCGVMIIAMDFGMYVFHRIAHLPIFYQWIHRFHHRHETTNPISLFVLHPFEVIGFGSLMILFMVIYPMSFGGLISYLTLNVLFGTLGHSGVEPLPSVIRKIPLLRLLGTSTFHAIHHEHSRYNFGFYTLLWDKFFGTLDPDYNQRFSQKD
jgi:Delta7-sterol 5-desaturase